MSIVYTLGMKNKRPKIDPEIAKQVQAYANKHFDGNFTKAVNEILKAGVLKNDYPR